MKKIDDVKPKIRVAVEEAVERSQQVGVRIHWRPESTQRGVSEVAEILSEV